MHWRYFHICQWFPMAAGTLHQTLHLTCLIQLLRTWIVAVSSKEKSRLLCLCVWDTVNIDFYLLYIHYFKMWCHAYKQVFHWSTSGSIIHQYTSSLFYITVKTIALICKYVSFQSSTAYVNGDGVPPVSERELEVRWKSNVNCEIYPKLVRTLFVWHFVFLCK